MLGGSPLPVIRAGVLALALCAVPGCGARSFDGWTSYTIADDGCRGTAVEQRVWAGSADDAWVASCGKVFRLREGELREDKGFAAAYAGVRCKPQPIIAGTGPSDIWVDAALHFDGSSWKADPQWAERDARDGIRNREIWGADPKRYFVVGSGMLGTYDDDWTFIERGLGGLAPLNDVGSYAVHGSSGDDVYVSRLSTVFHFDGRTWSQQELSIPRRRIYFYDVFVQSRTAAWAVGGSSALSGGAGNGAEVWRKEGGSWTRVPPPEVPLRAPELWRVTECGGTVFVASYDKVFGREPDGGWSEVFVPPPMEYLTRGITDLFCAGNTLMVMVARGESKLWIWR